MWNYSGAVDDRQVVARPLLGIFSEALAEAQSTAARKGPSQETRSPSSKLVIDDPPPFAAGIKLTAL
jgi:hypothetical protein